MKIIKMKQYMPWTSDSDPSITTDMIETLCARLAGITSERGLTQQPIEVSFTHSGGLCLRAHHYVGVISTGELVVEIRPKDGLGLDLPHVLAMTVIARTGLGGDPSAARVEAALLNEPVLNDLFVTPFLVSVEAYLNGTVETIRTKKATSSGSRVDGVINVEKTALSAPGIVHFSTPVESMDSLEHRTLFHVLNLLMEQSTTSHQQENRLHQIYSRFSELGLSEIQSEELQFFHDATVVNDDLDQSLQFAAMLWYGMKPVGSGLDTYPSFDWLVDLNQTFEDYVSNGLKYLHHYSMDGNATELPVTLQARVNAGYCDKSGASVDQVIIPDITWNESGVRIPIDAKNKATGNKDSDLPNSADFYQATFYATILGASISVLVYPTGKEREMKISFSNPMTNVALVKYVLPITGEFGHMIEKLQEFGAYLSGLVGVETVLQRLSADDESLNDHSIDDLLEKLRETKDQWNKDHVKKFKPLFETLKNAI